MTTLTPEQKLNESLAKVNELTKPLGLSQLGQLDTPTSNQFKDNTNEPVASDIYKTASVPSSSDPYGNYVEQQNRALDFNEDEVRSNILSQFQGEIDATKGAYSKLLGQVKQQGEGRLGEDTAIQARRGLLGSDFGSAQTEKTRSYNVSEEEKILAAQASAIAGIKSQAMTLAQNEIASRRAAKQQGGAAYAEYLASAPERKQTKLQNLSLSLLTQGISPNELDPKQLKEIAKGYGVTTDDIIASYFNNKDVYEAEKLKSEIEAEKLKSGFTLGADQARYDSNGNIIAQRANTNGINDGLFTSDTNPEYANVINTILASGRFTKDQTARIKAAINNGEDPFTVVKNNAKDILGTEGKLVTKYETARDSLEDIGTQLQEFYSKGGKTNLFKGNFEKVYNRLGEVNDPKLVTLATQIQGNLQVYRNAISGTAYSDQEGRDIASIFPGIDKGETLNNAILQGRSLLFDSVIDSMYENALGENTYQKLKGLQQPQSQGGLSEQEQGFVEEMRDLFYSDEEIEEALGKPISFNSAGNASASNRPQRNNNPLNIKASNNTLSYPGVKGKDPNPATDGGQFLVFNTPEDGFNAAKRLLQTSGYTNLTIDEAMKRWSNNGYGGEIIPNLRGKKISDLTQSELDNLVKKMAEREGYFA